MGMNLSGGFSAGAGADMLYKIVEQAALREQERKRNELAQEELRQREADRAAQRDYQNKSLARLEAEDAQKAADRKTSAENAVRDDVRAQAAMIPSGSLLSPEDAAPIKKYTTGLLEDASENPTDVVPGTENPLRPTGKIRFRGTEMAREKQATLDAQNRPEPVFVIDDKGVMRQVGTAPKGSHISNEPRPPTVPSPQPQIFYDGEGKPHAIQFVGGQSREIPMPGTLAGKTQPKPEVDPAAVRQQQGQARKVRAHIADINAEAEALDKLGLLGPIGGRWADFMAGRIGSSELATLSGSPENAQLLAEFRADVKLLQSGMAMVHGGTRGGSSPGMAARMEAIINADRMDLPLFRGATSSLDKWLAGYEKQGPPQMPKIDPVAGHGTGAAPKAGGTTSGTVTVTDPNGGRHTFPNQAAADAFKKAAGIQ